MGPPGAHMGGLYGNDLRDGIARDAVHGNRGYRHAPYNGTLYLPAGFHDYGIATVDELFVALVVGRCEFLCEYQDEIDEVYHGLFEKRI